jgi:hypothetical protein
METILVVILLFITLILTILIKDYNDDTFDNFNNNFAKSKIYNNDMNYYKKFYNSKKMHSLTNNNKLSEKKNKKNNILFITFDNRETTDYVMIHNSNINDYVKKFSYEYKYLNYCDKNVYWCKIYLVLEALMTNNYDYVVWMDSDTVIKNFNIDIGDIFNMFSSDIFIGFDNHKKYGIINSGVFAISNSDIGKNFLSECINYVWDGCFNNNGTLKGKWAASCYEQGVMNILIDDKYYPYTTVLTNKVILNFDICNDDVFIMHLYASSSEKRVTCFL